MSRLTPLQRRTLDLLRETQIRTMLTEVGFVDIATPNVGDAGLSLFLTARKPA